MKSCFFIFLFAFAGTVHGRVLETKSSSTGSAQSDVQVLGSEKDSRCLCADGAESVGMIYLHGILPNRVEAPNFKELQVQAIQGKTCIALPLAPNKKSWGYAASLAMIEQESASVCQKPLAQKRSLFGFSRGSYLVRNLAKTKCAELEAYSSLLVVGMPQKHMSYPPRNSECRKKIVYIQAHKTPSSAQLAAATAPRPDRPTIASGDGRH